MNTVINIDSFVVFLFHGFIFYRIECMGKYLRVLLYVR